MSSLDPSQLVPEAAFPADVASGASRDPPARPRFARSHRWDRNFFLVYVALIWAAILDGFLPEILKHIRTSSPAYPAVVHLHAAVFVGWLLLLTVQVLLIRSARVDLHRRLGVAGAAIAATMIVIGPTTAVIVDRLRLSHPDADPGFLIIQLMDIVAFAGLVVPAFVRRNDASAHKRLMLLATLYITDAGFARWWGSPLERWFGDGLSGIAIQLYLGSDLLVLGVGLYDWMTRKRLHVAYVAGVAWIVAAQVVALAVYMNPRWPALAAALLGR
jgi:hypothetical protein